MDREGPSSKVGRQTCVTQFQSGDGDRTGLSGSPNLGQAGQIPGAPDARRGLGP